MNAFSFVFTSIDILAIKEGTKEKKVKGWGNLSMGIRSMGRRECGD